MKLSLFFLNFCNILSWTMYSCQPSTQSAKDQSKDSIAHHSYPYPAKASYISDTCMQFKQKSTHLPYLIEVCDTQQRMPKTNNEAELYNLINMDTDEALKYIKKKDTILFNGFFIGFQDCFYQGNMRIKGDSIFLFTSGSAECVKKASATRNMIIHHKMSFKIINPTKKNYTIMFD